MDDDGFQNKVLWHCRIFIALALLIGAVSIWSTLNLSHELSRFEDFKAERMDDHDRIDQEMKALQAEMKKFTRARVRLDDEYYRDVQNNKGEGNGRNTTDPGR